MNSRILFIDYARTIALFLVVFAHMYTFDSKEKLYIYAFHMPFFFLVSGMLYKEIPFVYLIKKMSKRLLIPFCFFLLVSYLYFVVSSCSLAIPIIKGSLKGLFLGDFITANHVLWFFVCLYIVRILCDRIINKSTIFLPLFLLFFVFCVLYHVNYFYIGTSLMAVPFFLYGYYAKNKIQELIKWKYSPLFSFVLLFATIVITNYNGRVSMMAFSFGQTEYMLANITLFYINGIVGSLMIMCLAGGVKLELNWLSIPSRCAVSIVGLQFIPYTIFRNHFGANQNWLICASFSIVIMCGCILFHLIVKKKTKWVVGE